MGFMSAVCYFGLLCARNNKPFGPATLAFHRKLSSRRSATASDDDEEASPHSPMMQQVDEVLIQHEVTWRTPDGSLSFLANDGELLRSAAIRQGVASPHNGRANLINCRGLGTCGTCAVEVEGGFLIPPTRNAIEMTRLSLPPGHGSSTDKPLRLACQVQVRGPCSVTKRAGFWGQFDELVEPTTPDLPFGELEYLLDFKSPNNDGGR